MQQQINTNQHFNQLASSYDELLQLILNNKIESEVFNVFHIHSAQNIYLELKDKNNQDAVMITSGINLVDTEKYKIEDIGSFTLDSADEIRTMFNSISQLFKNMKDENVSKDSNDFTYVLKLDEALFPIKNLLDLLYDKTGCSAGVYYEYIIKLAEYMWNNKIPFTYKSDEKSNIEKAEREKTMLEYLKMYENRNISRKEFLSYIEANIYRSEDEKRIEELTKEKQELFDSVIQSCKRDDVNN